MSLLIGHSASPSSPQAGAAQSPAAPFASSHPIEAMILLAGTLRPTSLLAGVNRSVLDLPITQSHSLLQHWLGHTEKLAASRGQSLLTVRILLNEPRTLRFVAGQKSSARIVVECDPQEYRGTGGVLRDIAEDYPDDAMLLVSSATTLLLDEIAELTSALTDLDSDVGILSNDDGTSTGPMLIRCGALRGITPLGFVDFKEQALPAIAAKHRVKAVKRTFTTHSTRTREGYLNGLKHYHWRLAGKSEMPDPFVEDWQSSFSVIEPDAEVAPSAVIHDSVVLAGARVEANAVVVRSVLCPGSLVQKNETVLDRVVTSRTREA